MNKGKQIEIKRGGEAMLEALNQEQAQLKNAMIEEMAKIIDDRLIEARNYLGSMNKGEGYWIAQKLVYLYQPKIAENEVVISKEEWKQIKSSLYYSKEELEKKLDKARKETAQEILNCMRDGELSCKYPCKFMGIEMYNELAKEFGVEIKE